MCVGGCLAGSQYLCELEQITFCPSFLNSFIYKGFEIGYHLFFSSLKHSVTFQQSLLPIKHAHVKYTYNTNSSQCNIVEILEEVSAQTILYQNSGVSLPSM